MGQPRSLFSFIFVFSKTHYKSVCKKCPSSKWRRDLNSQPLEHESPPITTRPGLPPRSTFIVQTFVFHHSLLRIPYGGSGLVAIRGRSLSGGWEFKSHLFQKIKKRPGADVIMKFQHIKTTLNKATRLVVTITWDATSNQNALFQHSIVTLH